MAINKLNGATISRFRRQGVSHIDYSLTLTKVYIDNNGICQKCYCKTVLGEHPQVENSATMEHIIPISNGGQHLKNNVTLLCHKCNSLSNKELRKQKNIEKENIHEPKYIFKVFGYKFFFKKDTTS